MPTTTSFGTTPASVPIVAAPETSSAPAARRTIPVMHIINGEHFAGAERVQQHLGKHLGRVGFDPIFACMKPGVFPELCDLRSNQIFTAPMQNRLDFRVINQISDEINDRGVEILHAHTPRTAMITSILARRERLPWVYHVHSPAARDSTRSFFNRANTLVERFAIRSCSQLITVSRSLRREMLRLGVPRSRLSVVPNGVPATEPIEPATRLDQDAWNIGMIALMRPRKGVEVALNSMQVLDSKQQAGNIKMQFIGSFETNEYEQEIRLLEDQLCVGSRVEWKGFVRDIPNAIRKLDALILPSLFGEGMPMVVLEALSAGVPVIATSVEGTPEVIRHGHEGLIAEPGNAESLANSIDEMTSCRNRWAVYSQNAVERHRESFSDTIMTQRVANVYEKLLRNSAE
ncbi:MAG: glycosyltransferase family 4 protein [Aureliella sp.]